MMLRIIGVSEARSRLRELLDEVKREGRPVILARDSRPEVVLVPYEEFLRVEKRLEEQARLLWNARFDKALAESRSAFRDWVRARGLDPDVLSEEEAARLIGDD